MRITTIQCCKWGLEIMNVVEYKKQSWQTARTVPGSL